MVRSLEIDEFIVGGIAKLLVEPDPFQRMQNRFGGQRPAFKVVQFRDVTVPLDHDVLVLSQPLDFLDGCLEFIKAEIVQGA